MEVKYSEWFLHRTHERQVSIEAFVERQLSHVEKYTDRGSYEENAGVEERAEKTTAVIARMLEVLIAKGVMDADDFNAIMGTRGVEIVPEEFE